MAYGDEQTARIAIESEAGNKGDQGETAIPVHIVADEGERPEEQKLLQLAEAYLDQLRRVQAEFVNYKRRMEKERAGFAAQGRHQLLKELLPVLDDFDHLLAHHGQADAAVAVGLRQVADKLQRVLSDNGLERFGQTGERFDPELHEAVATAACPPEQEGLLLEVWQPGYRADGKVLRAAKVKVGRAGREGEV